MPQPAGSGWVRRTLVAVFGMLPLAGWAQLDEITVTTRKKFENIQDVPIAVDAISAEQISRRGISSVADVVKLSTSLQFD